VGPENIFIFGLTAEDVQASRTRGAYRPRDVYARDHRVRRVLDALDAGVFCPDERDRLRWISRALLDPADPYVHLADLPAYLDAQDRVAEEFARPAEWAAKAILNVARIGAFSSDRTVREYARDVWRVVPVEE
jgi:starch phosphorylase